MELPDIKPQAILTHEYPDLDAMMSVMVLRKFGDPYFEGISQVPIRFCAANRLPEGKTAWELEKDGIIAVDVGGGRFDTHPTEQDHNRQKRENSATDLIAKFVGILDDPNWAPIIEYTRLQDVKGQSISSSDYVHHLVSLSVLINGINLMHPTDSGKQLDFGMSLLENIPFYVKHKGDEFDWQGKLIELSDKYLAEKEVDMEAPAYENFKKWYERLVNEPEKAFSRNENDILVSIRAIITGGWFRTEGDEEKVYALLSTCFDAILLRERMWEEAKIEFKANSLQKKVGKGMVSAIESANGLVIRASRYFKKGHILIYRDPVSESTLILKNRNNPLARTNMRELAEKVRIAECVASDLGKQFERVHEVGERNQWFMHQSYNMLQNGSKKATDFIRTKLTIEDLLGILESTILDDDSYMPEKFREYWLEYKMKKLQRWSRK